MSADRYVALGLARARAPWFTEVARWATSATLPLEFVKCLSTDEASARLTSGRPFSALLVDGALSALDRDLIELARSTGTPVLVVDDARVGRDWVALGATATLDERFGPDELRSALEHHARPVVDARARLAAPTTGAPSAWMGSVVAVTGGGGTGASTLAMAAAQGMAADPRNQGSVILADLALDADQALLHHVGEVVPGLPELVEAHRAGVPEPHEIDRLTFTLADRGYRLLLGLRRHRDWPAIRRRALHAALESLRRSARVVVADIEPDVEGEDLTGSGDVEDRNLLARSATAAADLVVVVGRPDLAGLHRLVRLISVLRDTGVPGDRIQPVVNRAGRSPRARAEVSSALAQLVGADARAEGLPNPLFVPDRRNLANLVHDAVALPDALCRPVAAAVAARLETLGPRVVGRGDPVPVVAGSVGHWSERGEWA